MNNLYRANYNYEQKRGDKSPHKNKAGFKNFKDNTMHSLNEVGYFLNNLSYILKYVKLYNILK